MKKSLIALTKGQNRYQNVFKSLKLLEKEIRAEIKGKKKVVIKVNFVSGDRQLAATHVEAVRALLDFLKPLYKERIPIVEKGILAAGQGFTNFGYLDLPEKYNVEIGDYSHAGFEKVQILDHRLEPCLNAEFSKLALDSDFLISVTPAKTHDSGIVTLGLKNIVVGFLQNSSIVHQGCQAFNLNLYLLIKKCRPHLSIIDGTVGMEGDGPAGGSPKKSGWVLASLDSAQADIVATHLMGFDPQKVGYLHYCLKDNLATTDFERIVVRGEKLASCRLKFKPHRTYQQQLNWNCPPSLKEKVRAIARTKIVPSLKKLANI